MSDTGVIRDMLRDIADDLGAIEQVANDLRTDNQRLERENELLRARIDELKVGLNPTVEVYSDDLADAARDREREADFAKSEDYQDRGARD